MCIQSKLAHFLRNAVHASAFGHAHSEAPQARYVFRAMVFTNAAAVFVIIAVEDLMAAVRNYLSPYPPAFGYTLHYPESRPPKHHLKRPHFLDSYSSMITAAHSPPPDLLI